MKKEHPHEQKLVCVGYSSVSTHEYTPARMAMVGIFNISSRNYRDNKYDIGETEQHSPKQLAHVVGPAEG